MPSQQLLRRTGDVHPAVGLRLAGFMDYNYTENLKSGEKDNPNPRHKDREKRERLTE